MVALLKRSVRTHFRQLKRVAGVPAIYRRNNGGETSQITVVPGNRNTTIENQDGSVMQSRDRDILIEASDLVVNSKLVFPDRYDEIDIKNSAGTVTVETLRVDTSPAYSDSDGYGSIFRIHAKVIAVSIGTTQRLFRDANGDYFRDANGDYFFEIVNIVP